MDILPIAFEGLVLILAYMTLIWFWSLRLRNAGIVDPFWGLGFVILVWFYVPHMRMDSPEDYVLPVMTSIWGLRLFFYLFIRNYGKPEDHRYAGFRQHYGAHRYWWVSFFQVFMLQGILLWLVSSTLLGGLWGAGPVHMVLYYTGIFLWLLGLLFESLGDYQLSRFKADPRHKGQVMDRGLWRYTRHPNYFGETMVWWGFGLIALARGNYWGFAGTLIMTWLLIRISGVAMLEPKLEQRLKGYAAYKGRTSAFFPWFPRG